MGLETGSFISDLNANNPVGATDPKSQGDDHIRLIKATILATFPNIAGAVTPTQVEINLLAGATGKTGTGNLVYSASPTFTGSPVFAAGSIADAALTSNIPKKDAANVFTAAQQVPSLELGHASDTTLTRVAAGRVSIEGGEIAKLDASEPFTARQNFTNTQAFRVTNATGGADEKAWSFETSATALSIATRNDAGSFGQQAFAAIRSGTTVVNSVLYAAGASQLYTQDRATAPATTGAQVRHADGTAYDVGLNVMPPLARSASTTFARTDVGKTIVFATSSNTTQTIPASTDTGIPVGSVINLYASSSGNVTIAQGSGITLSRPNGTGAAASGNRVLAQGGVATLWKFSSAVWVIWGNAGLD